MPEIEDGQNPAEVPERRRQRLRRLGMALFKAVLAAGALYVAWRLAAGIGWRDLAARLGTASRPLVAAAVLFLVLRFYLWDLRFRIAAARVIGERAGALFGFPLLLASAALNLVNPAARLLGGPLRARHFARRGERPFGLFYGIVLYDQLAHQATISFLTALAVALAALAGGRAAYGWAILALLAAGAVVLFIWNRRQRRSGPFAERPLARLLARRAEREGRLSRLYAHGHEAVETFVRLLADAAMNRRAAALGAALFLANAVAQWLVFRALGEPVAILPVVAVVALGNAAGMLMGTPGGLGTTEATMVAAYVALGVDRVAAGAATLLFRGLHYALVIAVGGPALVGFELRAAWSAARRKPAEPARRAA